MLKSGHRPGLADTHKESLTLNTLLCETTGPELGKLGALFYAQRQWWNPIASHFDRLSKYLQQWERVRSFWRVRDPHC